MAAALLDHYVEQGATFRKVLRWSNALPTGLPGTAIDLTGYSARMQIRKTAKSPVLVSLTSAPGGGLTLGGVTGLITIYMTDEQTQLLEKNGVHDLEVESADGEVYRVVKGKVILDPNVTRPAPAVA